MKTPWKRLVAGCLLAMIPLAAYADFLIYTVPTPGAAQSRGGGRGRGGPDSDDDGSNIGRGPAVSSAPGGASDMTVILPGKISMNPGKPPTYTYNHPILKEPVYFSGDDVEHKRATTTQQEFGKRVLAAGKDPQALMRASLWGLKKGLTREFYTGIDKTLEADPKQATALRIREVKKQHVDQALPENPELEKELRNLVKSPGMQIATSHHFILLSDVAAKPAKGERKSRSAERLELLERTYESFLMVFLAQDVELDIPRERMKVVLFNEQRDFDVFAERIDPAVIEPKGFWEPTRNISVFTDHLSNPHLQALEKLQSDWQRNVEGPQNQGRNQNQARRGKPNPNSIRSMKIMEFLVELAEDNADMSAVSHVVAHQIAGTTGLLPRQVEVPRWVKEGLATYFETPLDGTTTTTAIGSVSDDRLESFKALEKDRLHTSVEFIAGDQIFGFAKSRGAEAQGRGQSWALTHFLLENHPKEFIAYLRALGQMPPEVPLSPGILVELFSRSFGADHEALFREWRQSMQSLKTDVQLLEESAAPARGR